MSKKQNKPTNSKSKYFKWGFTAFLVIMASVLSIYTIINISNIASKAVAFLKSIMPILDGLIVAYILSPLVDMIENKLIYPIVKKRNITINDKRKKIVRYISVFLSVFFVLLLIVIFIRLVVPQLILSIQNIILYAPTYLDSLINIANKILENLNLFKEKDIVSIIEHYYEDIMEFMQQNILPSLNSWVRSLSNSVFSFLGAIWDLIIGFFIAIYLLISKERFRGQFKKAIYSLFETKKANQLIADIRFIDKTFISFIGGKIVDSIIIGLICFIIIRCFDMPYYFLISVIIGVTNIIPFFGPFFGAIPSAVLILLIDPIKALYFVIIIIILQQIDGNFIGPMILGNSTGLSGFWVIFSITLFGSIWGVPGMFLGVPTFACIYAWLKRKMYYSLRKKDLSTNTDDYIGLETIKDKKLILKKPNGAEFVEKKKYISLDDVATEDKNINEKLQDNLEKTKEFFSNIIHKDNDNIENKNVNEIESAKDVDPIHEEYLDDEDPEIKA